MPARGDRVKLAVSAAVESVASSTVPLQFPRRKNSATLASHSVSVEWPALACTPNQSR